jgi:AcrR family transcriptional regulator
MQKSGQRAGRRRDGLSASVIVGAAIEILDADGEEALTFRALAARLATGSGAIYHYVANKDELLDAAAAELVGRIAGPSPAPAAADESVLALMLGVFDMINAHPWLGAQLSRKPWQTAILHVFESVGQRLESFAIPQESRFDVASALVNHMLGAAGQSAAGSRIAHGVGRSAFLKDVARDWTSRASPDEYPFVHAIAAQLAHHDDRQQFTAGVNLILAGVAALPQTGADRS